MTNFIKEREFGEIVQDTFSFFKNEIKPLVRILLVFVGPFALYAVYFMFKYQDVMEQEVLNIFKTQDFSNLSNKYFIFLLFSILQQIMLVTTVSVYIKMKIENKDVISISSLWNKIYSSIINIAYGQMLIITAIMSVFFLAAITGLLSFIIFALLGATIYIFISMYMLSFIIVFEEISTIDAIKRSLQLIRGNWWFSFGLIIIWGLIVGLSEMIISTIIKSIIQIVSTGDGAVFIVLLFSSFISVILSAISPILAAYLYASHIAKN